MRILAILIASWVFVSVAAPSPAQAQRLPRTSESEQQVDEINRSMQRQQRQMREQQQNQFEFNQLRQDLNRQQNFPAITGRGVGRVCAPGQVAC
jgi:exonuclease VII large subunit